MRKFPGRQPAEISMCAIPAFVFLAYAIREGRLDLVPYLAVVGGKEEENQSVALRSRKDGELGEIALDSLIEKLVEEAKMRTF